MALLVQKFWIKIFGHVSKKNFFSTSHELGVKSCYIMEKKFLPCTYLVITIFPNFERKKG